MARHLVPLTWRSIAQSFSPRAQVAGSAWLGLIIVVLGTAFITAVLMLLRDTPIATDRLLRGGLVVGIGIGCFVTGAITHPADPLDERAVALLGKAPGRAAFGTLLASILTPAPLVLLGLSAVVVAVSMPDAEPGLIAAAVALVWLTWLLLARLGVRTGRGMSGHRWGREASRLAGYCLLLVLAPLSYALLFLPWQEALEIGGQAATQSIEWIPPANVLLAAEISRPLIAFLSTGALVIVLLLIEVSVGTYSARRAMRDVTPGGSTRLGFFRNAAGSGTRAIAARIALAWFRDGRYGVVLSTVIVVPLLFVIPIAIGGLPLAWLSLLPVPIFAFLLGWSLHNDTAYDSTALWLHVTAGMRGVVDRVGRSIPGLAFGAIVVILGSGVTVWFTGELMTGVTTLGVSLALLGSATGGSAIMSAWRPYPVARPGDSPFSQPIRSWGPALVAHPFAGLIEIVLCGPVIWLSILAVRDAEWNLAWGTLGLGLASGAILCMIGLYVGGWVFHKRAWRLLEFSQSY